MSDRYAVYRDDPVLFMREQLGFAPWSMQAAIAEAVRDHDRVAVRAANATGKTAVAAALVPWWLAGGPGSIVVTTATTERQGEESLVARDPSALPARARLLPRRDAERNGDLSRPGLVRRRPVRRRGRSLPGLPRLARTRDRRRGQRRLRGDLRGGRGTARWRRDEAALDRQPAPHVGDVLRRVHEGARPLEALHDLRLRHAEHDRREAASSRSLPTSATRNLHSASPM